MVKQRYGCLKEEPVYLLERATKTLKLKNGQVAVQSLKTGYTAIIKRSQVKKISSKYPKNKTKC